MSFPQGRGFDTALGVPNRWRLESGEVVSAEIWPYGDRPLRVYVESDEGALLGQSEIGSELASEALLVHKVGDADWFAVFRQSNSELVLLRFPSAEVFATIPLTRGESSRGCFHDRGIYGGLVLEVEDNLVALEADGSVAWLLQLWPTDEVIGVSSDYLTLRRSQHPTLNVHLATGGITSASA